MELLTVLETARQLRVAPITVRRYIADGRLKAVKVGKGIRVPSDAVERFLEPVSPSREGPVERASRGKPFTPDDPLWSIVGIGRSAGAGDVSEHKDRYLAEAYLPRE